MFVLMPMECKTKSTGPPRNSKDSSYRFSNSSIDVASAPMILEPVSSANLLISPIRMAKGAFVNVKVAPSWCAL